MIIGIDPGKHGAMVIIHDNSDLEIVRFAKCSIFDGVYVDEIFRRDYSGVDIFMEKVGPMPWDTPKTAWAFSDAATCVRTALAMSGGAINYVLPQQWQKELHLERVQLDKKLSNPKSVKAARKKAYVDYAKKMFPKYEGQITLETADAVLIAEYGHRKQQGVIL